MARGRITGRNEALAPLTIKELARLAGVSIGTVDRVLHQRGRVSAENTAKIEGLIAERGYKANVFASRLSAGRAYTVGVLMPRSEQDFGYWSAIEKGIRRMATELAPFQLTVHYQGFDRYDGADCARAFAELLRPPCDALALAPILNRVLGPLVDALPPDFPVVFFDTDMKCEHPHGFVGQDPFLGGQLAARLLALAVPAGLPLGLVRFEEDDQHLFQRALGFESRCSALGHPVIALPQTFAAPVEERRLEVARFLLTHPQLAGLFVPNANVGEYARLGPGLRLVGYDLTDPNVQALREGRIDMLISQRPETMGAEALRLLGRHLLFHEALPASITLPLDVVLPENLEGLL
ncbi:MAG: substrate-binding domain-containing protein [Spirochaetales bacterium]